jgi:hypothetical protein
MNYFIVETCSLIINDYFIVETRSFIISDYFIVETCSFIINDYFKVETCSLIITLIVYVVLDCIFPYIIYSNQHNGIESI